MEKQGMTPQERERAYDAGYVNALLQLKVHINAFVDKPNSQTKKVFDLIDTMLEITEDKFI
jgi:hypothetical protein